MMVHTKGPWRAERQKSFSYSIQTDYIHDRGHDCNVVREVRCEANAFLIAAAPELLEALRELVAISGEANIPLVNAHAVRQMGKFMAATEKAKAAITKAERGR